MQPTDRADNAEGLFYLPVAVQGEGCSQGVVHHRAGAQVPSREQTQEQNTDNPLASPVERGSLGTSYKKEEIHRGEEGQTRQPITRWLTQSGHKQYTSRPILNAESDGISVMSLSTRHFLKGKKAGYVSGIKAVMDFTETGIMQV